MFGAYYFGQGFFGDADSYTTNPDTRPECGGMFGTATFGQAPFGYHFQCGEPTPPIPPTPTPTPVARAVGGGRPYDDHVLRESLKRRDEQRPQEDQWPKQRQVIIDREEAAIEGDDEDIAILVSFWLNMK